VGVIGDGTPGEAAVFYQGTAAKFREETPEGTQAQERVKAERNFGRDGVAAKTSRAEAKAGRPEREGQTNKTLATAFISTLKGKAIPWEEGPDR
jgi:hypothetical protein